MGYTVQVHKKKDKRGTWAYHSVYGWYLATSPEHYRTHVCYVKETKSKQLTDTVQFNHKRITNPKITHADKILEALAGCAKAITDMGDVSGSGEMKQLQRLATQAAMKNTEIAEKLFRAPVAAVDRETAPPAVDRNTAQPAIDGKEYNITLASQCRLCKSQIPPDSKQSPRGWSHNTFQGCRCRHLQEWRSKL
jgi:hypothetical protein